MRHADDQNIVYPLQHGCRSKRSGESQLIEFIDDISKSMDNGKQSVLVMDFSKAFDKVSHPLLVHKLHHYGIRGKINTFLNRLYTGGASHIRLYQFLKAVDLEWSLHYDFFNPEICNVISINRKFKPVKFNYTVHGYFRISSSSKIFGLQHHPWLEMEWTH